MSYATKKDLEQYIGRAASDSVPISGTDLHEVTVEIGVWRLAADAPLEWSAGDPPTRIVEIGSIWRLGPKAWMVRELVPDWDRAGYWYAKMIVVGGTQGKSALLDQHRRVLDEKWQFVARDLAAFEKLRSESAPVKARILEVDGKRVPRPGDVWRWTCSEGETYDWTLHHQRDDVWFATSHEHQRPQQLNLQPNHPGWTFVRSAEERPSGILSRSWSTVNELCPILGELLADHPGASFDFVPREGGIKVRLYNAPKVDIVEMRYTIIRLGPLGIEASVERLGVDRGVDLGSKCGADFIGDGHDCNANALALAVEIGAPRKRAVRPGDIVRRRGDGYAPGQAYEVLGQRRIGERVAGWDIKNVVTGHVSWANLAPDGVLADGLHEWEFVSADDPRTAPDLSKPLTFTGSLDTRPSVTFGDVTVYSADEAAEKFGLGSERHDFAKKVFDQVQINAGTAEFGPGLARSLGEAYAVKKILDRAADVATPPINREHVLALINRLPKWARYTHALGDGRYACSIALRLGMNAPGDALGASGRTASVNDSQFGMLAAWFVNGRFEWASWNGWLLPKEYVCGDLSAVDRGTEILKRRRTWENLAEAFSGVWAAMQTPKGNAICQRQLRAEALRLRPKEFDPRGWFAVLANDWERASTNTGWMSLTPWGLAETYARMIRGEVKVVGETFTAKQRYEAAIATPRPPDGKWRWRRGARR